MSYKGLSGDEKILAKLHPHPLAFMGDVVLWLYTIIVTLLAWSKRATISAKLSSLPLVGGWASSFTSSWGIFVIIAIMVLIPVIVYSLFKITWRPIASAVIVVIVAPAILAYLGYNVKTAVAAVVILSLIQIVRVDFKRRRHVYIVTDRRIITEYKGLFKSSRRDIVYSRLTDIVTEKGFLGKLFNFGNVYIVTQSGMGLGADYSALTVGAGTTAGPVAGGAAVTGGKSVNVPESRPQYVLYAVPHPEDVAGIIADALKASEEAPYLRKIVEKLDNLKEDREG